MIVPTDLQALVGRKELRYSLKTGYLGLARPKASWVAGQLQLLFARLRKWRTALATLSDNQIPKLLESYIKSALESWDTAFYADPKEDPPGGRRPFEVLDIWDDLREDLIEELNMGEFDMLAQPIDALLARLGITDIDKASLEYRKPNPIRNILAQTYIQFHYLIDLRNRIRTVLTGNIT
jgi:hypothetical protein